MKSTAKNSSASKKSNFLEFNEKTGNKPIINLNGQHHTPLHFGRSIHCINEYLIFLSRLYDK